jgi:hypothetical protein
LFSTSCEALSEGDLISEEGAMVSLGTFGDVTVMDCTSEARMEVV